MFTPQEIRDLAARDAFHYDYLKSATDLPEAAAFQESFQQFKGSFQDQCPWLLVPLRNIVAEYATEMDLYVMEKHILLKMFEFSIRMTCVLMTQKGIIFPYGWQLNFMQKLRNRGYVRIGFLTEDWQPDDVFHTWHLDRALNYCFRPACGSACRCSEPLTTEYLESHFRNGDYLFY